MSWLDDEAHAHIVVAALSVFVLVPGANAQKTLSDGTEEVAAQIAESVLKAEKLKIAVLPFRELDGRTTVLGTYISEELVTKLFMTGDKLEIVERTMLDKVIGELKLTQTGLFDPATAKKVGMVVGVDAVVTGTITDLQSFVAINCRLIDVQTGSVFGAAQTKIVKDDDVRKILGATLSNERSPEIPSRGQRNTIHAEAEGFTFEIDDCRSRHSTVSCSVRITNNEEDRTLRIYTHWGQEKSRIVNGQGAEFVVDEVFFAGSSRATDRSRLVSGIPVNVILRFKNASEIGSIRLLDMICGISTRFAPDMFYVSLRDIPLVGE